MDEMLIGYWNANVRPEDTVYYLGDFQFHPDPEKYLPRLNGTKILIKGNHDYERPEVMNSEHWAETHDVLYTNLNNTKVTLCHYAMRVWPGGHRGSTMLFGHSHNRLPGTSQSLDVGVDAWNYRPVRMGDIQKRLKTLQDYNDPSFRDQQ